MVATLKINVKGLDKVQRNLSNPKAVAQPVRRFLLRSADYVQPRVQRRIRRGPPGPGHNPGEGKASVKRELDTATIPRFVKIFSNLFHIFVYEFGAKNRGQRARRPFRQTLRRSRKVIFGFANDAGREIARMLSRGR